MSVNVITRFEYTAPVVAAIFSAAERAAATIGGSYNGGRCSWRLLQPNEWRLIQHFAHFGGELFGIERLGQKKHFRITTLARSQRFLEISGNKNHAGLGTGGAEPICEMPPAHLRHNHVCKEKMNFAADLLRDEALRIIAIRRFNDFISEATQHPHRHLPDTDVIL